MILCTFTNHLPALFPLQIKYIEQKRILHCFSQFFLVPFIIHFSIDISFLNQKEQHD